MAPLSSLCARTATLMLESRPNYAPASISRIFILLRQISARVESDWALNPASQETDEDTPIWTLLKTLLFSTLLISEAILSSLIYESHLSGAAVSTSLEVLLSLYHLSFVISKFGGVTAEGDFPELKKAFYTGLDILSSDAESSVIYVLDLCDGCKNSRFIKSYFS